MDPVLFVAPTTVEAAIAELRIGAGGGVAVLAGGTDLLLDLDDGRIGPRKIVSLRHLPWKSLAWYGDVLEIGSTLPLRRLEADPQVRRRLPGLWQAVRAVGSVPLRHRATIGGNLGRAAPTSDLVPILLAVDAEVDLVGPSGERRLLVDRFVRGSRATDLGPAELIRSVRIPEARPSAFLWQRVRPANDISQVGVAVAFSPRLRTWRVAVGGIVPRPLLVPERCGVLEGPSPPPTTLRAFAESAGRWAPFSTDLRASDEYRRRLLSTLIVRAVEAARASPEAN